MASRADLAAGQRARVKVPGQSTRESALDTIPPVNTSAAVSPMGEERRIRTTAGGGRCPTRTRSLRGSHAGSHTDERLCNFPDFGEHPAESCLRPRTDLNGPECLYGYLRIRRCRPCHIRATHDGDGRSNTVTTGSSLQAPSRTEPYHRSRTGPRHRSSKLVMRVRSRRPLQPEIAGQPSPRYSSGYPRGL